MQTFSLNQGNLTVRVWCGELPHAAFPIVEVLERTVAVAAGGAVGPRRGAVEANWHAGPRVLYGLLGASFAPEPGGALRVQVAVSGDDGRRLEESLAWDDEVRVGLLRYYGEDVLDTAAGVEDLQALGGGVLRFDCAARGLISSAPAWFGVLARAVIRLIASGVAPTQEGVPRLLAPGP